MSNKPSGKSTAASGKSGLFPSCHGAKNLIQRAALGAQILTQSPMSRPEVMGLGQDPLIFRFGPINLP